MMARKSVSLDKELEAVKAQVGREWADAYKVCDRPSAVRAAVSAAVVRKLLGRIQDKPRGWDGVILVREAAKEAAIAAMMDDRGRGNRLETLHEFSAVVWSAIEASYGNKYGYAPERLAVATNGWFVVCAVVDLMRRIEPLGIYERGFATRYWLRFSAITWLH